MTCLVSRSYTYGAQHDELPEPDRTAPVAIPRALARVRTDPYGARDEIVAVSRALPDGKELARVVDTQLDNLVIPAFAAASPGTEVYRQLIEARAPTSSGVFPKWPIRQHHRIVLETQLGKNFCEQACELIPKGDPVEDPDRWALLAWLDSLGFRDVRLTPALRAWAARAAREGHGELAWSLSTQATSILVEVYGQRNELVEKVHREQVELFEALGWTRDAGRTRRMLSGWQPPAPPPRRPSASVEDSLLAEASAELASILEPTCPMPEAEEYPGCDPFTAGNDPDPFAVLLQMPPPGSAPVPPPRPVLEVLAHVWELWDGAGSLDPRRLELELPQAVVLAVRKESPVAEPIAAFGVEAAARLEGAEELTAMLGALRDFARDRRFALLLSDQVMHGAERALAEGRDDDALALAELAHVITFQDRSLRKTAHARALGLRAGAVGRAAGDLTFARFHETALGSAES